MRFHPACLCGLLLAAPRSPAQETWNGVPAVSPSVEAELRAYIDDLARADLFSGTVAIDRAGEPLLRGAWGEASKSFAAPNRLQTRFALASASKMFVAVAVAQLESEGKVDRADPVGRYLPDFPLAWVRDEVTIDQLLTHRSGLGDLFTPEWERSSRSLYLGARDYLPLIPAEPLSRPGAEMRYSNAGFAILEVLVEEASGLAWSDYLREHIFGPAGMKSSAVISVDDPQRVVATGYSQLRFGDRRSDGTSRMGWWSTVLTQPAQSVYSTAEDMLRFLTALDDGTLVSREERDALLTETGAQRHAGGTLHYGRGFALGGEGRLRNHGHGGDFHGMSVEVREYPELDVRVAVLSNYGDSVSRRVVTRFEELMTAGPGASQSGPQFRMAGELSDAEQAALRHPAALLPEELATYTEVALRLIEAINAEDEEAYRNLCAPEFLVALDEWDPWKHMFLEQLAGFGRIERAWPPRRGPLKAGGNTLFGGHPGGVSLLVKFEDDASGSLTFTLNEEGLVVAGSCWFKRGFAESNLTAEDAPIFELP